tara:strand:- start:768 stop:1244 length:477 start_codon:yes stop_codon:yes gene_type:complete
MYFKFLFSIVLCLFFTLNISCVNTKVVNGQLPDAELLSALKIGKDKKNLVEKILGSPSFKGELGDNSIYYVFSVSSKIAFMNPTLIDQKVLQVKFDKENILEKVMLFKKDDVEKIVMSAKTTKTAGKTIGFFEQLISNIGVPGMGRGGPAIGSGRASD